MLKTLKAFLLTSIFWPALVFASHGGVHINLGGRRYGAYWGGGGFDQTPTQTGISDFNQLLNIIRSLIGWGQILAAFVAVIFFLYGGFKFITGDTAGGRNALVYAAIGLAVAILAFAVVPVVCALLNASGPACEIPLFG